MIFVIIALGLFAFETIFPTTSTQLVSDYLSFKFGLNLTLNISIIGNVIWFLLLLLTIRYFQVAVHIERQYEYIHNLEDKLNEELGKEVITREGKHYLSKYPYFSDWMWFLYTIFFPVLLLAISGLKIFAEIKLAGKAITGGLGFNFMVFVLLTISIVLYLLMIHSRSKKKSSK
jgi:hypothetical protein